MRNRMYGGVGGGRMIPAPYPMGKWSTPDRGAGRAGAPVGQQAGTQPSGVMGNLE